ncbi:MAG: hypothetical protein ABI415_11595, partial [Flavitalea sp.]
MKNILTCLLSLFSFSLYSQIAVTGSSIATSVPNNGPAIVVDPALTVVTSLSIPAFKVSVSANFNTGDLLTYTGTLPSGVSASYASGTGILT